MILRQNTEPAVHFTAVFLEIQISKIVTILFQNFSLLRTAAAVTPVH